MPEFPDLEAVKAVLIERVLGQTIQSVDVRLPLVVRDLAGANADLAGALAGRQFIRVERRGKFLLLQSDGGTWLVINPMLRGRLYHVPRGTRIVAKTHLVIRLANGMDLRYVDPISMGKVYLTGNPMQVPGFAEQGPEALEITLDEFRARLRRHPGEIKRILCNASFVAGIGNAYADEILFRAGIYPFRRRPTLSDAEVTRVYDAMRVVLADAAAVVRERMGEDIDQKIRDFLQVHGKGGQPCLHCGTAISEIRANQRITNFCRRCQPGALVDTWRKHR